MYKIKSETELKELEGEIHEAIYQEANRIVKILDESYNSKNLCGGYLYIATKEEDMEEIQNIYPHLVLKDYEFMDSILIGSDFAYASLLYILSAEDTISLLMPKENLPIEILEEEKRRTQENTNSSN